MQRDTWYVDNGAGWDLEIERFSPRSRRPGRRPVVMVPGYAMNAFILSYHPRGSSLISYLVDDGFEVWTTNLRGQGGARRHGGSRRFGLGELALDDLPLALAHVRAHTTTGSEEVDLIGCSLGASLAYAYLAHHPTAHRIGALVSLGGPLRWEKVHPAIRIAFRSARLAAAIEVRHTRRLARLALPWARRVPGLLDLYMNTAQIDLSQADQLVNTVDDPVPHINRQLARWIRNRDLVVRGLDVTAELAPLALPVLCVVANADGIVPPASVLSVRSAMPRAHVDELHVGDAATWYAHADLFISDDAARTVFEPMRAWLERQNVSRS